MNLPQIKQVIQGRCLRIAGVEVGYLPCVDVTDDQREKLLDVVVEIQEFEKRGIAVSAIGFNTTKESWKNLIKVCEDNNIDLKLPEHGAPGTTYMKFVNPNNN